MITSRIKSIISKKIMAARETVRAGCKIAKPILSTDYCDTHKRVMGLYRAYYRYIPYIGKVLLNIYIKFS